MPRLLLALVVVVVVVVVPSASGSPTSDPAPPTTGGPLATGLMDLTAFDGPDAMLDLRRAKKAGASVIRLSLNWAGVMSTATRPPGFDATNPKDPSYDWSTPDLEVKDVVAAGLQPLLAVVTPANWALGSGAVKGEESAWKPDPVAYGEFAKAAALHYDGNQPGIPRVRYWEVYNEPNLSGYLSPQYVGKTPFAPAWYRKMVNAMSAAVHSVHADNVVDAGGLAPYGSEVPAEIGMSPLTFMRQALCMSAGAHPHPTCNDKIAFDAWSVHPYTWGGPTHHAYNPNDVAIGDLPKVRDLLDAAIAAHHITSSQAIQLWVTEFSWDSDPPDPHAAPIAVQSRWISEAFYRMWQDGVTLVTWFMLRDQAYPASAYQSGLYYLGATPAQDKPKPSLTAFRFPFVAELDGKGFDLWGRTPTSKSDRVIVEEKDGATWKPLMTLQADENGIFQGRWDTTRRTGYVRARLINSKDASLQFGLQPVPDVRWPPFG